MLVEVKVPVLAESVPDATLLDWYKQVGERVERGDSLIDLETDKVTLEVAAPESGVLKEIRKRTGDVVLANEVLAVIDTAAVAAVAAVVTPAATPSAPTAAAVPDKLGPAARKLVAEHGVAVGAIAGSGKGGRVTKADVLAHLDQAAAAPAAAVPAPLPAAPVPAGARVEERVPMTRLRKRTAERLLTAQRDNALLTTFNEVNMQSAIDLRNRYKDDFEKRHGVRLGFMSLFVKAAVEALEKFPVVNASIDGDDIVYHGYFDIGVAVGSERGLVVPILRDVEQLGFADIEREIARLAERARDASLSLDELSGGTFTISNGGVYGSLLSTPILNPPQSGILGMHKIEKRPIAVDDQVEVRPMMYVALSYDHRIIDGREAVQFLLRVKECVEDPARILIGI